MTNEPKQCAACLWSDMTTQHWDGNHCVLHNQPISEQAPESCEDFTNVNKETK